MNQPSREPDLYRVQRHVRPQAGATLPGGRVIGAEIRRGRSLFLGCLLMMGIAVWGIHHAVLIMNLGPRRSLLSLTGMYALLYLLMVWQMLFAFTERPITCTARQQRRLDGFKVADIMPLYNEDDQVVRDAIASKLAQTRKLYAISVTDDGSNLVDYVANGTVAWFHQQCAAAGVKGYWHRTPNRGKRHAQANAIAYVPEADILSMGDSDSLCDPRATEEALKGFADPQVMSVAAMVAAANTRQNLFTRVMDLWYVSLQFTDRSVMSRFSSVLVNYGALAYYKASVVRENLEGYLNETFMGRRMSISDDSLLTLYCLLAGKTVQQRTCWAFTYMPTNFKHHRKQQLRWMRGSLIRSIWRMRYLPVSRFAFWGHLIKWVQYVVATTAFFAVLCTTKTLQTWQAAAWAVGIESVVYYAVMLPYLTLRRADESIWYQLGTYALTPLAALWAATVLRGFRWWASITCWIMEWGTRKKVEVFAEPAAQPQEAETRGWQSWGGNFTDVLDAEVLRHLAESDHR